MSNTKGKSMAVCPSCGTTRIRRFPSKGVFICIECETEFQKPTSIIIKNKSHKKRMEKI